MNERAWAHFEPIFPNIGKTIFPKKKKIHLFLAQSCWMSWAPKIDVKFGNPTPPHPIFIYLSPARAGARAPAAIFSPPGGIISAINFMYDLIFFASPHNAIPALI